MKVRKKPIVVEAMQFNDQSADDICRWFIDNVFFDFDMNFTMSKKDPAPTPRTLSIKTLEGKMVVAQNDWVIRGVNGEFYPCKPDIFEKTYERVD